MTTSTSKTKSSKNVNSDKPTFDSKLSWLPKKTFELEITIPQSFVKSEYQAELKNIAKTITIKGFRKGTAPLNLVEKQVSKEEVYDKIINKVVTIAYFDQIKKHNLKPILNPQVTPLAMPEDKDWLIKATSCEYPEIKIGDYKKAIKALKAKSSIWTPDKAKKSEENPSQNPVTDNQILDEFINSVTIQLPDLLIEEETNRLLADMVDQIKAAGLTVQQYLDSRHLTQESLKTNYQEFATKSLTLEFALSQVAIDEKIEVSQDEVKKLIQQNQQPEVQKQLENEQQLNYLKLVLTKQKTIDFIKSL